MNSASDRQSMSRKSYELGEMLTDSSIDRVMAIDVDWNIIAWNATSEKNTGLNRSLVLGQSLLQVFPEIALDPEMVLAWENAFKGYKSFLSSSPGKYHRHHIENHFIPLKADDGTIVGVMNIMHDVAHRVKAEEKLAALNVELEKKYQQLHDANNALSTFTHIASKQIKEPLRIVYTSLELIAQKEGQTLSTWSRGSLRKMQGSLNRINLLLSDLLTISDLTHSEEKCENLNLDEVLKEELNRLSTKLREKNAKIIADELPTISGYRQMFKYLFRQLIDNALKFQPEDQQPEIGITSQEIITEHGKYYQINILDNGIGFEPSDKEQVFEMFSRLRPNVYRGSGIGLSLCKKIIELHGGTICAEATPGKGTVISCMVPGEISKYS